MTGRRAVAGAEMKVDANEAGPPARARQRRRDAAVAAARQRVAISSTFGPSWPVDWILTEFDVPLASGVDMAICW
jgi:hypothetical protein